jgi:UDP-N-acetylmuramate dehydrogenase
VKISRGSSLKAFNTFGIDAKAACLAELFSSEEILSFIRKKENYPAPLMILGEGSNTLFVKDFPGTILHIESCGISVVSETVDEVIVRCEAGEDWDEFVSYCVQRGWGGLENLSLIPGKVGTTPVQNIGAYGAEAAQVIDSVGAVEIETGKPKLFTNRQCRFGYRRSIFKCEEKGKYLILYVTFRLKKNPGIHTEYRGILEELDAMGIIHPGIKEVREAVIRIRRRKLPDPLVTGNAGSFFKNPVISSAQFTKLRKEFPSIEHFIQEKGVKIPAAWLIDQCGWKGKRFGDAGVHPVQPLVLVNYGHASGKEILSLAKKIQNSVEKKFGIRLEAEVNIIG